MATTADDEQRIESKVVKEEVNAVLIEPKTVVSSDTTTMEAMLSLKSNDEVDDALPVEVKESIAASAQEQVAESTLESTKTEEEQPKVAADDVSQSSDQNIEKTMDLSHVVPAKDEESVDKKISASSIEGDEPVSAAPTEEQFDVNQQETTMDEATTVLPIKSNAVAIEEEEQSPEGSDKTQDSLAVHPIQESEAVPVKNTNASEILSREADEPKPVVDVKPEEPFEVTKGIEDPEVQGKIEEQAKRIETERTESEVPVKLEERAEVAEKVDDEKKDATPDAVSPEVQVKPEAATPVEDPKSVTVDPEVAKPESTEPEVELKPNDHTEVVEQSTGSEIVKDDKKIAKILSSEGESLPVVAESVSIDDTKKETDVPDTTEVASKALVVETGKTGLEKEGSTITDEGKNEESDEPNAELDQPNLVADATNVVSNAEVTEEIAENIKEETDALVKGKLEEATTTTAKDLVKDSQDSGPEEKEPESENFNEDEPVKEKVEDPKITEVVSKEVGAKKQSNNILSKMKQSLVKAKKAIVGKSPGSKTPSPGTIK